MSSAIKVVEKKDPDSEVIDLPENQDKSLEGSAQETSEEPVVTMEIKNMKVVATWKFTMENEKCLCRQDPMMPTQRSIRDKNVNGNVVIGTCHHGYHEECITRWIKEGNVSCPICKTTWKAAKHVGGAVYVYKSTGNGTESKIESS